MTGARSEDIRESQRRWRAVRDALKQRRHELAVAAGALYPDVPRVEGTGLLCRNDWVAGAPIEVDQVDLRWAEHAPVPPITASSAETSSARPPDDAGHRFETYADAIGALDRPALFENRPTYRLLDADLHHPAGRLDLPSGRSFECRWLCRWKSVGRELREEMVGEAEDYVRLGSPVRYEQWGFCRRLTDARQAGSLRVSILGLGIDPLTLVADILAVAVFDAQLFDEVFDGLVAVNSEGNLASNGSTTGFAFTAASVDRFSGSEPTQAPGAAVLKLPWAPRPSLLP